MESFSWKIEDSNGEARVVLSGAITENSDFSKVLAQAPPKVTIDLEHVDRINSCGVREWINFVNDLGKGGKRFALDRCSPAIVNQLNLISNFRGGGEVRSVLAPYFCSKCNREHHRVLDLTGDPVAQLSQPFNCPDCSSPMEFDDIPEAFLSFRS